MENDKLVDLQSVQNQKRKMRRKKESNHILTALLITFLLLLVGFLAILNSLKLQSVEVEGNVHYTDEEICKMANVNTNSNIIQLYFRRNHLVQNDAYIQAIEIQYITFNSIKIIVSEKEIIGYIDYMGKYLCIDRDGRIIDYTSKRDSGIPLIEGFLIHEFQIGKPLGIDPKILEKMYYIIKNIKTLQVSIDRMSFNYSKDQDISLYHEGVEIEIGSPDNLEEKMSLIKKVLEQMPEGENGILDVKNIQSSIVFRDYTKLTAQDVQKMLTSEAEITIGNTSTSAIDDGVQTTTSGIQTTEASLQTGNE